MEGIRVDKKVGIDAGTTLIKLAYNENGTYHFKKYSYKQKDSLLQWLQMAAPDTRWNVTGGKGHHFLSVSDNSRKVAEFSAITNGAMFMTAAQKLNVKNYILVNIGTGTSFFSIKENFAVHLYGSGTGGGMLMGLSTMLIGERPFSDLAAFAERGDRSALDLQVRDIYASEPPTSGDFTASNFGKATTADVKKENVTASLFGLIAETTMLLGVQSAKAAGVVDIVYTGGMTVHPYMKKSLKAATEAFGCKAHFLTNGEYCGAMGALIY